ncbi:MAG: HlyC/CorC family transporter [Chloroflexi bacterium]|nr:HlyC/CorC family transporter [Chloroflexota bacterium]
MLARLLWGRLRGCEGARAFLGLWQMVMLVAGGVAVAALISGGGEGRWGIVALSEAGFVLTLLVLWAAARLAAQVWDKLAVTVARGMLFLSWSLFPAVWLRGWVLERVSRRGGPLEERGAGPVAVVGHEELPDEREMGMIRAVLRLERTRAYEVMVPRVELVALEVNSSLSRAAEVMLAEGHRRIPVYEGGIDHVRGVVHARDLLRVLTRPDPGVTLSELLRPILLVPESKRLDDLLAEFQKERVHIAVVVDEYGGTAGIVTLEDLLEEIVGDMKDEFSAAEPEVEMVKEGEALLAGRVNVERLRELFQVSIEDADVDTVGGLVYAKLGKIPSAGDEVTVDGLRIQVVSVEGRRIRRVRVVRLAEQKVDG